MGRDQGRRLWDRESAEKFGSRGGSAAPNEPSECTFAPSCIILYRLRVEKCNFQILTFSQTRTSQIVALLNAYLLPSPSLTPTFDYVLFMPYYRLPLSALLNSPSFVPPKIASSTQSDFSVLAHTLIWQMMDAVRYLHANGIAHRDISVGNFVLSDEGRIVLIDFGISVEEGNEAPGEMSCEIGTGSVRPSSRWCKVLTIDSQPISRPRTFILLTRVRPTSSRSLVPRRRHRRILHPLHHPRKSNLPFILAPRL